MSTQTLPIIAVAWGVMRFLDLFSVTLAERLRRRGRGDLTVLLHPMGTGVKVGVGIIAIIVWLNNVGFNVTTLMAGLGIGGLAGTRGRFLSVWR
jgi:MscS family membrane protein